MANYVFGIDVGGTSVKCGLFQTDGTLLEKWEIPTRTENGGSEILPDIAKSVKAKMAEKQQMMLPVSASTYLARLMTKVSFPSQST